MNEAIQGLRVYGKEANKNKLVVRHLFWKRPQFKPVLGKETNKNKLIVHCLFWTRP